MPSAAQQVFEFRGVDKLYVAEVLQDDENGYVCGTPIHLAPVAEIGKNTDSASDAHYYDNKAMIVINSESADTISITMAPPELSKLAMIIGKSFDATTGMLVDSPRQNKYFAIMYRTKGTDGKYRYVSRLKGQFTIPEETSQTEDDGTDASNCTCEFTGIYTEFEFTKGMYNGVSWEKAGCKGIVVDTRYGLADVSDFFDSVQTPDTISVGEVEGIAVVPSAVSVEENKTVQLSIMFYPSGTSGDVTWTTSDNTTAYVNTKGLVTGIAAGTATIQAACNGKTDTCAVTVTAAST